MIKIAFYDTKSYDKPAFESFGEQNGVVFKFFETKLTADTVRLAEGCDGVCAFVNDTVDAAVIDALEAIGIKLIAMRCAGYNNVDIKHARGKMSVVNVPSYSPFGVAEHTMAMLLTSIRRIHKAYIRTRDFNFSLVGLTGFELHKKTVGIIGMGKIGQAFAAICRGFGMRILAYDKYPTELEGVEYVTLDRIYAESDVISFHCPLTPSTYHMLNSESIGKLKKGVVIINTSRGALIEAEALLEGIKSRKIGATCLDVYEEESDMFFEDLSGHIMEDDVLARLISMPNVIVTSHQAFLTEEALSEIARVTTDNICRVLRGESCDNDLTVQK